MTDPLAYFLTWTCYGTWLHGDERGSVDRSHNAPGAPLLDPNPGRRRFEIATSRQSAFILDAAARRIVNDTIVAHCEIRAWRLMALNVRSNHVHVVVDGPHNVDRALVEFKAWATRRLREAKVIGPDRRVWTDHGSTRYLWRPESVDAAIRYVLDGQGPELE